MFPCLSLFNQLTARLAQSAERKALNLVVVGSSPTVGVAQSAAHTSCAHKHSTVLSSSCWATPPARGWALNPRASERAVCKLLRGSPPTNARGEAIRCAKLCCQHSSARVDSCTPGFVWSVVQPRLQGSRPSDLSCFFRENSHLCFHACHFSIN